MTTSIRIRNIPDDAPATAFAPVPVGAYRRGFEDRTYDNAWFCPYAPAVSRHGSTQRGTWRRQR